MPASGQPLSKVTLVLGGARSGKSAYAESLLGGGLYLATGQARDPEMAKRVREHQERRGPDWTTVEEPLGLASALARLRGPVLIDCLTLWLSNLMEGDRDPVPATEALCQVLAGYAHPVVLVANEVGLGIVPDNALARAFRDQAGRMNQRIALAADRVVFVAAGLPLILKDTPQS